MSLHTIPLYIMSLFQCNIKAATKRLVAISRENWQKKVSEKESYYSGSHFAVHLRQQRAMIKEDRNNGRKR